MEASMSIGVRHFWQYKPWLFLSFAMSLLRVTVFHVKAEVVVYECLREKFGTFG